MAETANRTVREVRWNIGRFPMSFRSVWSVRTLVVFFSMACGSAACKGNPDSKPDAIPVISESLRTELTFVPRGMEVLARLDLGELAARDAETVGMLEFLLRAQQPA